MKLHIKLMLSYTALIAAVVVSVDVYLNRSLRDDLNDRTRKGLLTDARLVRASIESYPPVSFSRQAIDLVADRLGEQAGARVTIIALDGTVLGDSEVPLTELPRVENHATRPEVVQALRSSVGESIRHSHTVGADMAYAAVPFALQGRTAGVVRLALPLTDFDRAQARIRRIIVFASVFGLVLAVVLSYATSRLVSTPIERMISVARRMATGDFSVKATAPFRDELHDLAGTLNELAAQSKARITQMTEENAQLEAVLAGMTEGVMVTDTRGRIILTNPAFDRILGFDDGCLGKRPIEVVRNVSLQEAVDTALSGSGVSVQEIVLPGGGRTLEVHLAPIRISDRSHGLVAVFHDITDLRRLERVRRDFVANVSHELRTPLTSIKGYAETLLDGALDDATAARRFLEAIQKHANRLQALVEDLLQLSRLESGRTEVNLLPCDLGALARRVVESLDDRMSRKRLSVQVETPDSLSPALADEALMEQVFFNLLDNAIKYTPDGGRITVRVYAQPTDVHVEVTDTGIGIPAEALPRIFERFYRVDRARSRELGGTGLGLSIVKHIVEVHGGRVWAESEMGRGSTFHLALAAVQEIHQTGMTKEKIR
ncbi:MAG: PAS domain S-box protein [Candidatus Latescibacteria bacterium]|nr:PAS domain S-box protein [Candidatus Latescibacterota bacterium]